MAKIGITFDVKDDWTPNPDDPADINAEFDSPKVIDRVEKALNAGGHTVQRIGNVHRLLEQIDALDVDIVLNLCEGRHGRNRESQVPILLELKDIPHVGADALTLGITLDKVVAKRLFISAGLPTPRFFVAKHSRDLEKQNIIGYPLMVKTSREGTSKGISEQSRVEDLAGLKRQVDVITQTYHQPALVEEFIRGQEFTVPVLGNDEPEAMPVLMTTMDGKQDLGDAFFTFERVHNNTVDYICPAPIGAGLTRKIQALAVQAYECVECRDFGRVDFRVDEKDNPHILEINPLPSLSEKDAYNIFPKVIGSTYDETINKVINFALQRYGLRSLQTAGK